MTLKSDLACIESINTILSLRLRQTLLSFSVQQMNTERISFQGLSIGLKYESISKNPTISKYYNNNNDINTETLSKYICLHAISGPSYITKRCNMQELATCWNYTPNNQGAAHHQHNCYCHQLKLLFASELSQCAASGAHWKLGALGKQHRSFGPEWARAS